MIRVMAVLVLASFLTPATPASDASAGWRPLFDGNTTAGWRSFKQKQIGEAALKVGEWNDVRFSVRRNHSMTWVNGVLALD